MVSRENGKYVIWTVYFDRNVSRKEGRRVPKKLAVENPSIDKIFQIAKELELNPVIERDARHPSRPWRRDGRVLVDKKDRKEKLIRKIAEKLV